MSLTRTFLTTLTASVLAAAASADIVAVRFKEPKVANRFKEHLVSRGGEMVLAGEQYVVEGGVALSTGGMPAAQTFDVIVGNSDDIAGVVLLLKDGTLATLAADYVDRKREVDGLFAARDVLKRDDAQWSEYHQQGVLALERMESWLRSMLYPAAADKLEKELVKQRKLAVVETAETRRAAAVASVAKGEVPDSLIEAAKEISGGSDKFSLQESQHCRIIYREGISDARVASLLQLAEEIISGFRVEFVDPYEDENFKDTLLDHQFAEWIFGYDDETKLDKYWSEYLGFNWDSHKEERL
jgi:hypothetical protein